MDMLALSVPDADLIELSLLNLMTIHQDERWKWRDLPRIQKDGMLNPIVVWRCPPSQWRAQQRLTSSMPDYHTIHEGKIYAVKAGNNRVQVAKHLGYNRIAALVCDDLHSAVQSLMQYREW